MYEKLKMGVSPITNTVFAGHLNKKGDMWLQKKDVTEQFLSCCLQYFEPGTESTISADGKPVVKITLEKIE